MSTKHTPTLLVVGSGIHALSVLSTFDTAATFHLLRMVWVLPHQHRKACVYHGGGGWANDVQQDVWFDPEQVAFHVDRIVHGSLDAMLPNKQLIVQGECISYDAMIVALDPFLDCGLGGFAAQYGDPLTDEEIHPLRLWSSLTYNMLSSWECEALREEVLSGCTRRRYRRADVETLPVTSKKQQERNDDDDEEGPQDDDDDLELERPTVVRFTLPGSTTQFASQLLQASDRNIPQVLFFAMNEGERSLSLNGLNLDNARIDPVWELLRKTYLKAAPQENLSGSHSHHHHVSVLTRDLWELELARNQIHCLQSLTETFVLTKLQQPISSMLRSLNLSHNELDKDSVIAFLQALKSAGRTSRLATLKLASCSLNDEVGEHLAHVLETTSSLERVDVSSNFFTNRVGNFILNAARHSLLELGLSHTPLRDSVAAFQRLFSAGKMETLHLANCSLNDHWLVGFVGALATARPNQLKELHLQENSDISAKALDYLFTAIPALGARTSGLEAVEVVGCAAIGVGEMVNVAKTIDCCSQLQKITLSIIEEEQLCLELICPAIQKHSALDQFAFSIVAPAVSRCDTTTCHATHEMIAPIALQQIEQKCSENRRRKEARMQEVAARSAKLMSVLDVAAEAAKACLAHQPENLQLIVDDSASCSLLTSQLMSRECMAYRHEILRERFHTLGGGTVLPPNVHYQSTATDDTPYRHFCDATVIIKDPLFPPCLTPLTSGAAGAIISVNPQFVHDDEKSILAVGWGVGSSTTGSLFSLALNSGTHWCFVSETVLKTVFQEVLARLCPHIKSGVPAGETLTQLLSSHVIPTAALRQRLLEACSLSFRSPAMHASLKRVKHCFSRLCQRFEETQPIPYEDPTKYTEAQLARLMAEKEIEVPSEEVEEQASSLTAMSKAPPTKAAKGKDEANSSPPAVAAAAAAPLPPKASDNSSRCDMRTVAAAFFREVQSEGC